MTTWLLLAAAIVGEVSASLSLKGALERPWLYAVVLSGYVASFALLSSVLRRGMPLGVAYGIWAAAGVASTALLSSLFYGEPLNAAMSVGIAFVVAGVMAVELGSRTDRPHARSASESGRHTGGPT